MKRYCFQLQVKPDRIEEYTRAHAAVWPEMLAGTRRHRVAQLLALPACRRTAHRLRRERRPRAGPAGDGGHRGQRPLAGRDGRPSSRTSTSRPTRGSCSSTRSSTSRTSSPDPPTSPTHQQDEGSVMTMFADIAARLEGLAIEVPSWAYGNSGTRFKVFGSPGHPAHGAGEDRRRRDRAPLHRPRADRRAAHPVGPGRRLRRARAYAKEHGVALGTINSNTFQDDDYKLGSLTNADPAVRRKAVDHNLDCIEVMNETGSRDLKVWLADGTNYPGQGDIRARQDWLAEGLAEIYSQVARTSAWCWSTSSSSRRSTTPTSPTGARRTPTARPSATAPWSASTPATTRPAPTSSSSSRSCSGSAGWAPSTSTAASTPTTTSSSARPTRSSCSGSWSR